MSYGVAGSSPFSDFPKPINEIVKDKLQEKWSLTSPDVKFGTGWAGVIANQYEVHCLLVGDTAGRGSTDWRRREFESTIDIHVFARRNEFSEPAQLTAIKQEINRIVMQNKSSMGHGISLFYLVQWIPMHDQDVVDVSYWHLRGVHKARYQMVSTI